MDFYAQKHMKKQPQVTSPYALRIRIFCPKAYEEVTPGHSALCFADMDFYAQKHMKK